MVEVGKGCEGLEVNSLPPMNANDTKPRFFKKLIGFGLIALALLGATSLGMKEIPLALFGERALGTVKKVEEITTSSDTKWEKRGFDGKKRAVNRSSDLTFMYVDFTTKEGKPMEVKTLATFHTEAKVGDTHPMIYLPWSPERAKIYSAKQLWLPMIVGLGFVTVTLLVGVRCLSRGSFFPRAG
jgi:hypothetical protein